MNNGGDDMGSGWLADPPSERHSVEIAQDGIAVFRECPLRLVDRDGPDKNWQIFYNGVWHWVCRTDWKDDVSVFAGTENPYGLMDRAQYGARIRESGLGPSISFIVAFSDG